MALGTELFNLATSYDPYGSFKEGMRAPKEQELKDISVEEQLKEAKAEQTPALGQMAGQAGTSPLAQQARTVVPTTWKLADDQGMPTVAGETNNLLLQGSTAVKQGDQLLRQARFETDPTRKERLTDAGRRLRDEGMRFQKEGQGLVKKATNDALYSLGTAQNSQDWDNVVKGWQNTGIPIPTNFPTDYSPENLKKVIQMAPMEVQQKIVDANRKREQEARAQRDEKRKEERFTIAMRELGGAISGKEYKDVRGQVEGLKNYIPADQISKLGPKEVPAVSSKLEAAALTDELATLVQQNPAAAGLVGSFYKNFDKFLPSRYDKEGAETATEIINAEADKLEKSGAPKDEITAARLIAKKAVDVINARALAASGGGRVLVSELRLQKDVLGLEGLSPTSAVGVYRNLAESDRKSTKRYGIDPSTIKREVPTAETKPAEAKPDIQSAASSAFGSYEPSKYDYRINPETGKVQRKAK